MSPGKEDQKELVDHVRIGDVEVVFEGRKIDIAVELDASSALFPLCSPNTTDILFHIFCAML